MNFWGRGIIRTMVVAYKNLFRPVITVQYPHEKVELPERSRWAVALDLDEEGNHRCTACGNCTKACPDFVLDLDVTTNEDKTKHINHYKYEIGACMMCGLCVEACPFSAIKMSHEYELARTDPALLTIDLLTDVDAAKPKRAERPPAAAVADKPAAPVADKPAAPVADKPAEPAGDAPAEPVTEAPEAEGGSDD